MKRNKLKQALTKRKRIAIGLLALWCVNMMAPAVSYALTSGPAQPETKGFQPAGISDMVDLQTGELKYNIPLLDIDGYPINLSYQGNAGIDDEASWVGLGWSLNPGAINRQVRGIPDDFGGANDYAETDHYTKAKVTVGGKVTAKVEIRGKATGSGSFTFGVFSDNYTGMGAELGVNAGVSYSFINSGGLTAGLGLGVLSNTQSGADFSISPYVCGQIKEESDNKLLADGSLSCSLGYNSRSGMKNFTLGSSFSNLDGVFGASTTYNTPPISPTILTEHQTTFGSFSFDAGPAAFAVFASLGGTGYQNVSSILNPINRKPAFGFLYAEKGKNNPNAVMDFIREKDNPVIPETPDIAIPIPTPDMWSYTSQSGSGQFRLYRGGSGSFFDSQATDGSSIATAGGDLGYGYIAHVGITFYQQNGHTSTSKWQANNNYLSKGDFQDPLYTSPTQQHVFFRQMGERGQEDEVMNNKLMGTQPLAVNVRHFNGQSTADALFKTNGNYYNSTVSAPQLTKTDRRQSGTVISYLTAAEAGQAGLDNAIQQYPLYDVATFTPPVDNKPLPAAPAIPRVGDYRQANHISELTVTDGSGKRMVYGIPVYNTKQEEYSFAVGTTARSSSGQYPVNNQVNSPDLTTPNGNTLGIDNYYHKESKSAYATSYLLTGILSPDYVDKTGKGISEDDLGTAIKFNYAKLPYIYKWRTPYSKASLNKALLADPDDDKGSIVYGEKELWYVSSIESKTKIAYFITQDRQDALGVNTSIANGDNRDLGQKQRCLREIRLYSKADVTRPIKVVKFNYSYELCRGIPNSADLGSADPLKSGKLTLTSVWFEYGNSDKGKYHPYTFQYNKSANGTEVGYDYMVTDRWGTYKQASENGLNLNNEEYPYTNQTKAVTDINSALWRLSKVALPTGGVISVDYESNDYAYVQDQKAMAMAPVSSLINSAGSPVSALNKATGLSVNVGTDISPPGGDQTAWFKKNYLDGSDYLYAKMYVKMSTPNQNTNGVDYYDYVPVYCQVTHASVSGGVANIQFATISESSVNTNPMSNAAWQRIKNEYPRYAYPGFDNRVNSANNDFEGAISAIISAARNLSELKTNFYQKANSRSYGSAVILSGKSFVKITKTNGFKLGGGARVKAIHITDQWQSMAGGSASGRYYGQAYTYTTTLDGNTISSGVATYEPGVGNDENALKQPITYVQKIKGAINNYFELEKPFCESLYPAPAIGYSKVTVQDLDQSQTPSTKTGYLVNEFYTAKDFPVTVGVTPIVDASLPVKNEYSLVKTNSIDLKCLSQGYSIQLNDMHGKPKANRVFNQSGSEISSTVYYYSNNNTVNIINNNGQEIPNKVIGRDIEFFTDFRQQETSNTGTAVNLGADIVSFLFLPFFPLPHWPVNVNDEFKQFRSASSIKVVQTYGIVSKVVKTENGSSITTENIAYDGVTGEPVVTRTQNEFNKDIFSVNLPAYWAYNGMGPAYPNLGLVLKNFTTNANGEITSAYATYMHGGDEICDLGSSTGDHYWVVDNTASSGTGTSKKLIKRDGTLLTNYTPANYVKVVRSGFRNVLNAGAATLVCLNNPIVNDPVSHLPTLQLASGADLTSLKVINASASTYDESWGEVNNICNTSKVNPVNESATHASFLQDNQSPEVMYGSLIDWSPPNAPHESTLNIPYFSFPSSSPSFSLSHLQDCLIKLDMSSINTQNVTAVGFDACLTLSQPGQLIMGSINASLSVDGQPAIVPTHIGSDDYSDWWNIEANNPTLNLASGQHTLSISFPFNTSSNMAVGALEIYYNGITVAELSRPDPWTIETEFSTGAIPYNSQVKSWYIKNGVKIYRYTNADGTPLSACNSIQYSIVPKVVNPYVSGFLGNWRPYQTKVFQQNRHYNDVFNAAKPGIDAKNAGYINNFYSYWYNTANGWLPNPAGSSWVNANTVTLYDKYGQQLENQDALLRYSAAKFDFNGELPAAVASNAMNRQIYAASLEDSKFKPGSSDTLNNCNIREFVQPSTNASIKKLAVSTYSHSGNYSVPLPPDGLTMSTIMHTIQHKTQPYLALDNSKQYITQTTPGIYPNGFEPQPTDVLVLDTWVKDGFPNDKSINIALNLNGTSVPLTCKAVVEGWKLMEGTLNLASVSGSTLNISILPTNSSSTIYLDDVRIFPKDSQMKTYAYDDKTMRLMAEIDENGFATFYEYDDEGLLIRVKKETEKGIMTLKESRSSYLKNPNPPSFPN